MIKYLFGLLCILCIGSSYASEVSDGTIDQTFLYGSGFNGSLALTYQPISLQSDGKILVVGTFTGYNGVPAERIIRLNPDGTKDYSFLSQGFGVITGLNVYYRQVWSVQVQQDGKILVGGTFTTQDGIAMTGMITRLNSDGTPDSTFQNQGFQLSGSIGSYGPVIVIQEQADGKILLGGYFDSYNTISASRIIRLHPDGTRDMSFAIGSGFGPNISSTVVDVITLQSDGKILVGSRTFTSYNGVSANRIIRLHPDGSIDTGFNYGSGFNNEVRNIIIDKDGKILVGGAFTSYNGVSANRIIRLHADGSIDTGFNYGSGFNGGTVLSILEQSDGKLVIGGGFTSYNGVPANRIIRLHPDGSVDAGLNYGSGFSAAVYSLLTQLDGKLFAGGFFTSYNGVSANRIIRLSYTPLMITGNVPTLISSGNIGDTVITITGVVPVFATGVILDTSTASGAILCNQITMYQVQCALTVYTSGDITIVAKDINENITKKSFTGYIIDNTGPVITILSPLSGTIFTTSGDRVVNFTGYDNLSGSVHYECQINNGLWVACADTITVSASQEGPYTVNIRGIDGLGNIGSGTTTFTIMFPIKSSGGGGGGSVLVKDNCPDGDYSPSYYDNVCGTKPTNATGVVDDNIFSDSEVYNDTVQNGYCYTRKENVSIIDSKKIPTSDEFKKALTFLYAHDMTMFNSIDQFDPYRTLTREEAAKIFSNFAINVLCRRPDTNLQISYSDVQDSDPTLQSYITLAYQLGLMKGGVDGKFRPFENITKAEFNAVLVRMILKSYLPEDTNDTWYTEYNTVSSDLGIIKYGADNTSLSRNDASLMLFRAYKEQLFSLQTIDYESFVLDSRDEFVIK